MHLKLDGHSFLAGLTPLRAKRKLPKASIKACPLTLVKLAEVTCGDFQLSIPIFDRRSWSDNR
jgi:hypothetical protein